MIDAFMTSNTHQEPYAYSSNAAAGCTARPLDDPETSKRVFAGVRDGMEQLASSNHGKLVSEKPIELDKHPGVELRFELSRG